MEIKFRATGDLEDRIREFMASNGLSAARAVRAMLGDETAMPGHRGASVESDHLSAAVPVSLSVWDNVPRIKEIGRPGYVMSVIKNLIFEMNVGDCFLVESFLDKSGRQVSMSTVSVCLNKSYKSGTFSVITRGVPDGKYIIRRNA